MRGLEIMNMQAILDGGEARTSELEYARQLASQAATYTGESTEIDHNEDGSYSVRLVPRALLDAAKALRTGMVREIPEPGVTIWSTPPDVRGEAREATARMERETRTYHSTALGVQPKRGTVSVGAYQLVIGDGDEAATDKFRRLELRRVPMGLTASELIRHGDALLDLVVIERELDLAEVFTMFNALEWEAEEGAKIIS